MSTKRKIILTVLFGVLVAIGVYCVVVDITDIVERIKFLITYQNKDFPLKSLYVKYLIKWIIYFVVFIFDIIISGFLIFKIWFDKKTKEQIKYSYQDYKNEKHKKQLEKLEKKKISIDNQINNLNK